MLEANKRIYASVADAIPNWREIDKSDLIRSYYTYKTKSMQEACVAAIMCRYWTAINKYHTKSNSSFELDDFHEWLQHAVLYVLSHQDWNRPGKSIYGKKNGPDIAMNVCINSTRLIKYQESNYKKRSDRYKDISLEGLDETMKSYALKTSYIDPTDEMEFHIQLIDTIQYLFKTNQHLKAFIIDGIINGDVFTTTKSTQTYTIEGKQTSIKVEEFKPRKLTMHLRRLDDTYCKQFAYEYGVSFNEVARKALEIKNFSSQTLSSRVKNCIQELKRSKDSELGG